MRGRDLSLFVGLTKYLGTWMGCRPRSAYIRVLGRTPFLLNELLSHKVCKYNGEIFKQ
jgi:hypothetical protein